MLRILIVMAMFVNTGIAAQTDTFPALRTREDSLDVESRKKKEVLVQAMKDVRMEYFIIKTEDNRFGYYILLDGRIYIEQTIIPAIQGLQGFISKDEAARVAEFVIDKIKQGVVPPMVTIEELNQLSITLPR